MVEVTATDELDAAVAFEMNASSAAEAGSIQHSASAGKPKRPGRGRARSKPKAKFVPDE